MEGRCASLALGGGISTPNEEEDSKLRRKVSHLLALVVVMALSVGVLASPAAAKMSAKQKAQVRAKLKKQVKKNPKVVQKKAFLKKAAMVNFRLPITVRLRDGDKPATPSVAESATDNPNEAIIDLGASLGQRQINLGGELAGEIVFKDSFDGGALGNVDLDLRPGPKNLTSTSIPLLWNTQVATDPGTRWDSNALQLAGVPESLAPAGCSNFTGTAPLTFGAPFVNSGLGFPGYPYYGALADYPNTIGGFLPQKPGIDSIDALQASKEPGNDFALGGSENPFPVGTSPLGGTPNYQDTVLRTGALELEIAQPGTVVPGFVPDNDPNDPVQNSQDQVIGKSGGQANLFGNIPGKSYGIDVTVSLATTINSIFRIVDQDAWSPLFTGANYPAGVFGCRQVWSGGVDNYIPGVRLQGNLRISPAITHDGKLRIAKATLASGGQEKPQVQLAACLVPYAGVAAEQNSSDTADSAIPAPVGLGLVADGALPADVFTARPAPAADCNDAPTELVNDSGLTPDSVNPLTNAQTSNGYTVAQDGSKAVVSGLLDVENVVADVLIGDV